ncbi:hypothetical protein [Phytohabitans rumicis]|nr:hypothetical protein [Phytohabitans rumicis]
MSAQTGDSAFLHELELNVKAELAMAESSQPEDEAEWLFDPADAEREEVGLRSLLGAVESLEDDSPHD